MKTVKFAPCSNSEAFSFNVRWISESRFLTIVCYHPADPKILSIPIQTINTFRSYRQTKERPKNPLSRRTSLFSAGNAGAAYYQKILREASVNCPVFLTQL